MSLLILGADQNSGFTPGPGANYFISAAGNDNNSGTSPSQPWKTIAKVNAHAFAPGDAFFFRRGDTFSGNIHLLSVTPTAALPLRVDAYGSGVAPIISAGNSYGVFADNVDYVVVQNLNVQGGGITYTPGTPPSGTTSSTAAGIQAQNTSSTTLLNSFAVRNCTVTGCLYGISATAINKKGYAAVSITGNSVSACGSFGIWVGSTITANNATQHQCTNVTISNNQCFNIYGISSVDNNGYGIIAISCDSITTSQNVVHDCGQANTAGASGGPSGIMYLNCTVGLITQCKVLNQADYSQADGDGIDLDAGCQSCTVSFNYTSNNFGFAYLGFTSSSFPTMQNCVYCNNISENDGNHGGGGFNARAFQFTNNGGFGGGIIVENNTFWSNNGNPGPLVQIDTGTGVVLVNNIFSIAGGLVLRVGTDETVIGNLYDTTQGNPSIAYNNGDTPNYTPATLAAAHLSGYEYLTATGLTYGQTVQAKLTNAGSGGTNTTPALPTTITAYDPLAGSPALGGGVNSQTLLTVTPATTDFHGSAQPRIVNGVAVYDQGAVV